MASRVVVDKRAWKKLYNTVKKLDGASVRVGALDGENATLAAIHEYGAPRANIPARPFIRPTFERRRGELVALQAKLAKAMLLGVLSEERAMAMLGAWAAGAIKATITRDGNFVPLRPATIARKHSAKPLIDTGQLVGAITFKVGP